jgi:hypothetical protein
MLGASVDSLTSQFGAMKHAYNRQYNQNQSIVRTQIQHGVSLALKTSQDCELAEAKDESASLCLMNKWLLSSLLMARRFSTLAVLSSAWTRSLLSNAVMCVCVGRLWSLACLPCSLLL